MVFSFLTWGAPFWGLFGAQSVAGFGLLAMIRFFIFGSSPLLLLYRTGLPTMVAALAWKHSDKKVLSFNVMTFWMPLLASVLFFIRMPHVVDAWYAVYWLAVPFVAALSSILFRSPLLTRAYASSMAAHMVGSLIVLYGGCSVSWSSLLSVVWFERLATMGGMLMVYGIVRGIRQAVDAARDAFFSSSK